MLKNWQVNPTPNKLLFYRERAKKIEKKFPTLLSELAMASGGEGDYSKARRKWLDNQDMDESSRESGKSERNIRKSKPNGASIHGCANCF